MPRTGDAICPREALKTLFTRFKTPAEAPLFCCNHEFGYRHNMYFTRSWFLSQLKLLLLKAGMTPAGFNGHSFWKGAAHSAAAAGMSGDEIKTLGRWKSDAYKLYTGHDDVRRLKLAKTITNKLRSAPRTQRWVLGEVPWAVASNDAPYLGGESAGTACAAHRPAKNTSNQDEL